MTDVQACFVYKSFRTNHFCHSEINIYVKYKTAVLLREPIVIFEKGAEY